MIDRGLVTFLVPAKDEAAAIAATLRALPLDTLHAAGFRTEVLVLDGHSRDATRTIARSNGAVVVRDLGSGKSRAVRESRSRVQGDYIVMLDADGTYASDAIPRVVAMLAAGDADVVMGDRVALAGSMTRFHRAGNAMLSLGATLLFGRRARDLCTGLWGFTADALRCLPLRSEGFALESELFAMSARLRLRVGHVPVDYLPRIGSSKLSTRDGLHIARCLIRNRFARITPRTEFIVGPPVAAGREARTSLVRTVDRGIAPPAASTDDHPSVTPIVVRGGHPAKRKRSQV